MQSENSSVYAAIRPPKRSNAKFVDLSGRRVGRLTVTDRSESRVRRNSKKNRVWWLCNCDCGRSKWVMSQQLLLQATNSCGCLRLLKSQQYRESLVGKQVGFVTIIADHSSSPERRGGSVLCRCVCGIEKVIVVDLFRQEAVNSCGCRSGILPPGHAARNIILARYKKMARVRGKEWELADKEAIRMFEANCHYCGAPPANVQGNGSYGRWNGEWTYNGIDRKDNDKGYFPDNVVTSCANCNRAKNAQGYAQFITWVERLTQYRIAIHQNECNGACEPSMERWNDPAAHDAGERVGG
jgi:hypothetical protein